MLQSVPAIGAANPRLLATFSVWTFLVVQVTGANTLYLAETSAQLLSTSDNPNIIDALQIAAGAGIVYLWWRGDLWAAGSAAFKAFIGVPGNVASSAAGPGVLQGGYGTSPSFPLPIGPQ